MKTISYAQKKWALTGCLLVALGFNLSMHKHVEGVASAELASSSEDMVDAKLATANGVASVKYIKISETQTLAHVTEGSVCPTCGNDFTLNTSFNKDNVDALNVALLKYVSDSKPASSAVIATSSEDSDMADAVTQKVLDAVEKHCEKKSEAQDKLECYGDKFTALMNNKQKVSLDPDKMMSFYKEHIENLVDHQMSESRRIMSEARRSAVSGGISFMNSDASMEDPSAMRTAALKVVEQIIGNTPKKYEDIRKRLVVYETELMKREASDVQQTFVLSRQTTNPMDSIRLMQEASLKRQDLDYLANGINDANQYGLDRAARYSNVNSADADAYFRYFNTYAKKLIDGLSVNPNGFQIPTVTAQPNGLSTTPSLDGRTGLGRTGNSGTITGGTPVVTNAPVTGGVTFGDQAAVTAEMAKMRAAVRNAYNLH